MDVKKTRYPIVLLTGFNNCDTQLAKKDAIPLIELFGSLSPKASLGFTDAFGSVENNVRQAEETIKKLLKETGCEKVNVIGISRGGFDARRAATLLGPEVVASVTTLGSPFQGSPAVEKYYDGSLKNKVLFGLMKVIMKLNYHENGDPAAALGYARYENAKAFDVENPDVDGIYYQSSAFVMKNRDSDKQLSKDYDLIFKEAGENDGVVPVKSAERANFKVYRSCSDQGISHYQLLNIDMPLKDAQGNGEFDTLGDVYKDVVNRLIQAGC